MKIFVTGSTGRVAEIVIEELHRRGAEVIGFAIDPKEIKGVSEFHQGSVTDYEALKTAMKGCETVLHLAALRMPYDAPEQVLFDVNVGGTFNVFKACAELGIKKLSVASSPNAIGYYFGVDIRDLSYLPVDGAHPSYTTDPYSFSKQAIEEIGRYFYRRFGISSVFMRLGLEFTYKIEDLVKLESFRADLASLRKLVDGLLALPEKEAAREVRLIENGIDQMRREAMTCGVPFKNGTEYVNDKLSKEQYIFNFYVHNFLMNLDSRDLASGMAAALESDITGSHDVFLADYANMLGIESAKIAPLLYPGAKVDYARLQGYDALVDYRATESLIGWRAKYSLADFYDTLYKNI